MIMSRTIIFLKDLINPCTLSLFIFVNEKIIVFCIIHFIFNPVLLRGGKFFKFYARKIMSIISEPSS